MFRTAAAAAFELSVIDGKAPEWIKAMPLGEIVARDGRKWHLRGTAAAQAVVDRTRAWYGNAEPFVDYDHQIVPTLTREPGATAKAAAWVKELEVRADGIYARVEWTPAAAAAIAAKEYRYVSPYFLHDDAGAVTALVNIALVNRPALDLPALAAADLPTNQESTMDLKVLLAALGLSETATEEDVRKAATAAAASVKALAAATAAAGLPETAKAEDLTAKIGELVKASAEKSAAASAVDPTQFVPREMFDSLSSQVKSMQETAATAAATQAVDGAIAEGKVAPAQRDWALGYAGKDLAGFQAFAAAAPKIVGASAAAALPPGDKAATAAGLSAEEAAVAAALGISPADYAKNREGN
ncbi:putative Mu-like prophage FluMu I protein [uncultured Alphaproteobacteria bacterium]|uniref:Putative Mu-like prophage FluMu I protein n=1 Tax=uncultured Alphaproteobacteria bacterium TaxID=91750 RepID=A0A212KMY5_9PROT|nr:putative Mu-like prophage FluMu I protein [uncultured Alphaproteobacteria bacterium]